MGGPGGSQDAEVLINSASPFKARQLAVPFLSLRRTHDRYGHLTSLTS